MSENPNTRRAAFTLLSALASCLAVAAPAQETASPAKTGKLAEARGTGGGGVHYELPVPKGHAWGLGGKVEALAVDPQQKGLNAGRIAAAGSFTSDADASAQLRVGMGRAFKNGTYVMPVVNLNWDGNYFDSPAESLAWNAVGSAVYGGEAGKSFSPDKGGAHYVGGLAGGAQVRGRYDQPDRLQQKDCENALALGATAAGHSAGYGSGKAGAISYSGHATWFAGKGRTIEGDVDVGLVRHMKLNFNHRSSKLQMSGHPELSTRRTSVNVKLSLVP